MESDLQVPELMNNNSLSLAADMMEETNNTRDVTIDSEEEPASFNISASFIRPNELEDVTVEAPEPSNTILADDTNVYEVVDGGNLNNGKMLLDNIGFGFTQKRSRGNVTYWWCSHRSIAHRCPATVIQRVDAYRPGRHQHDHPADPGMKHRVKIAKQVKLEAQQNVFASARGLVQTAFEENLTPADFNVPDQDLLTRRVNRARQKMRPADPRGEDFEVMR